MTSRFLATRRQALQRLGFALGSAIISVAAHTVPLRSNGAVDVELAVAVDGLLAHRHSAAVIGAHYLAKFESENSAELLAQAIRRSMPADAMQIDERFLLAHIRSDFERGEVVSLDGWILSRTEARLCALLVA